MNRFLVVLALFLSISLLSSDVHGATPPNDVERIVACMKGATCKHVTFAIAGGKNERSIVEWIRDGRHYQFFWEPTAPGKKGVFVIIIRKQGFVTQTPEEVIGDTGLTGIVTYARMGYRDDSLEFARSFKSGAIVEANNFGEEHREYWQTRYDEIIVLAKKQLLHFSPP